jgi:protocatechuate 3,4-dioxygenase beta subunit
MLGRAASVAATLVVSQSVAACSDSTESDDGGSIDGCVLTAALTEGPYFVDERLNRSDIRSDPATGEVSQGTTLDLTFNLTRVSGGQCTPLTGAYLDVWHCDAAGVYSDVSGAGASRKFLRGYQITDAAGVAHFTTVYPGWYQGRTVHVHFKLRIIAGATTTYEFTSQFFFNEAVTDAVYVQAPYSARGQRDTRNSSDGIFNELSSSEKTVLTLSPAQNGSGYSGTIDLSVLVG